MNLAVLTSTDMMIIGSFPVFSFKKLQKKKKKKVLWNRPSDDDDDDDVVE